MCTSVQQRAGSRVRLPEAELGSAMATHQVKAHQRHPRRPHFLVDAYCGVGLFAISLAKHFETVLGVEV